MERDRRPSRLSLNDDFQRTRVLVPIWQRRFILIERKKRRNKRAGRMMAGDV
jgi:hypothetical protein